MTVISLVGSEINGFEEGNEGIGRSNSKSWELEELQSQGEVQ